MGKGTIVKALSGFYYVSSDNSIVECKARGKFRNDGISPLVGDVVEFSIDSDNKGRVDSIYPRKNSFIRPAVANIDIMVFIAANTNPITDPYLIDRVSVISEAAGCETVICLNKTDLDSAEELEKIYKKVDYKVIKTSAETGEGIDELYATVKEKISAFTGNSGVGKSSILNKLLPDLNIKTDMVSDRLGRGKHTTRHVELYNLGENTYIADTPGFASFDIEMINKIEKDDLQFYFPEFKSFIGDCRFDDCAHLKEPGCAITQQVGQSIAKDRYDSYVKLYDTISKRKIY